MGVALLNEGAKSMEFRGIIFIFGVSDGSEECSGGMAVKNAQRIERSLSLIRFLVVSERFSCVTS